MFDFPYTKLLLEKTWKTATALSVFTIITGMIYMADIIRFIQESEWALEI